MSVLVQVTHYIPPNGETKVVLVEMPADLTEKYKKVAAAGLTFTIERLMTGTWSICLENRKYGDYKMKLFSDADKSSDFLDALIRNYDEDDYARWLKVEMRMQDEGPE